MISRIVPAYNEARYLPRLLDTVDAAVAVYRGPRDGVEVVVADSVSTDATAAVARSRGCRVVPATFRSFGASGPPMA